ncbi:MAG: 2-dehydropantoate 2-reductase [Lachnospiraceae bacterium]|jgi:5'(3')-deoxyribonucleotidase|nr:2-dehydropantoate 2-reductase [Lachnospiraceae bacterium]
MSLSIYVDFDDCLCETARHFSGLVADMYGVDVPYESINFFDLKKSFSLTKEQYDHMMEIAHQPEVLLTYEETPGAIETVNGWIDKGYDVTVITGRPYSAYEASREWLDRHGLERVKLYCLNKYGRISFVEDSSYNLELEDYYKMHFDYAVEDSPHAFRFFEHLPKLEVLVYDRPWNRAHELPGKNYTRCFDWTTIRDIIDE